MTHLRLEEESWAVDLPVCTRAAVDEDGDFETWNSVTMLTLIHRPDSLSHSEGSWIHPGTSLLEVILTNLISGCHVISSKCTGMSLLTTVKASNFSPPSYPELHVHHVCLHCPCPLKLREVWLAKLRYHSVPPLMRVQLNPGQHVDELLQERANVNIR